MTLENRDERNESWKSLSVNRLQFGPRRAHVRAVNLIDARRIGGAEVCSHRVDTVVPHDTLFERLWSATIYRPFGKRVFDVVVASGLLLFLLPLLAVIAFCVAVDGGRPIFSHRRVGLGNRQFGCLKFRSMVHGAEERLKVILAGDPVLAVQWDRDHKLDPDPRITRFGAFLRKTSLDELPQLVNVLLGDMSLVGPRPITVAELVRYGNAATDYTSVRPGITGLWQISGRNDLSYSERVELDTRYARTIDLRTDIVILLKTVGSVLRRTGK